MATVLLVRHATTAATGERLGGWTPGVHLDDAGRAQAERTAARLADAPLRAVYTSPLERTRETAAIIAAPHGLRVRTRRTVGEVDYGEWTDEPLRLLRRRKLWKVIQSTPSRVTFPGGESMRSMQARAVDAVERLATDHAHDVIAVVSHADVIKATVAYFLGMPLDTFQRLVIDPASVSTLVLAADAAPVVAAVNADGSTVPVPRARGRRATTTPSTAAAPAATT